MSSNLAENLHTYSFLPAWPALGSCGFSGAVFQHIKELETGCVLGRLPFSCKVSTHEQTMFFMSMGNLESVARLHCQSLNCKNRVNKVRLDPLPEILYCKITVCSTCPASLWKFDTTEKHPFIRQTAKRGQRSATTRLPQPCVTEKQHNWPKGRMKLG